MSGSLILSNRRNSCWVFHGKRSMTSIPVRICEFEKPIKILAAFSKSPLGGTICKKEKNGNQQSLH